MNNKRLKRLKLTSEVKQVTKVPSFDLWKSSGGGFPEDAHPRHGDDPISIGSLLYLLPEETKVS